MKTRNHYSKLPPRLKKLAVYLNSQHIRYKIRIHTFPTIIIINSPIFFREECGCLMMRNSSTGQNTGLTHMPVAHYMVKVT